MSTPTTPTGTGGDCTWDVQPSSSDWTSAANWLPATVPTDTATFGPSSQSAVVFGSDSSAVVTNVAFASGAPAYTFVFDTPAPTAPALTISGPLHAARSMKPAMSTFW